MKLENIIKENVKDFWVCTRCNITSTTKGRKIPCPRGGCEAEVKGKITTTVKIELL